MKKNLIIGIVIALVLGIMTDQTLRQSAIDIFQAEINYTGKAYCTETADQEIKSVSLAQIRLHEEYPDPCILSIELTSKGMITYFFVISFVPLLLSSVVYFLMSRKSSRKQ